LNYFGNKSPSLILNINVLCLVGILCIPIATFARCVDAPSTGELSAQGGGGEPKGKAM
jgi:hypothetical protein